MRQSGIIMHITSLPGPYGIGTMGKSAFAFVDFLKKAGQSQWQILPLTPTGFGDSPYQSCSSFAGNPYLIDLELLVEEGLLDQGLVQSISWGQDAACIDFGLIYQNRQTVLKAAFCRFSEQEKLEAFCQKHSHWLWDFALYSALKDERGGEPWYLWEKSLKYRDPVALENARRRLQDPIYFHCFVQYLFYGQWSALRQYANKNGVKIIGDVPIYVPLDSVEVWCDPDLFWLDEQLAPTALAGCPPDAFSQDGQLWGNPLYRWDAHKQDGFSWWLRRMKAAANWYDTIRMDHFRGFASYYCVPASHHTARNGQWKPGPGLDFFRALETALPDTCLIAEDLGFITPEVRTLQKQANIPGMKVLQFAFDGTQSSEHLPHNCTPNSIYYTGTHDNMTLVQWRNRLSEQTQQFAADYMHLTEEEGFCWGIIRTAMTTVSHLCMFQMQDFLELGASGRMNCPGTTGHNWCWRARDGFMTDALAEKIRSYTKRYDRLGNHQT